MWEFVKTNLIKNASAIIKENNCNKSYTYIEIFHEIQYWSEEIRGLTLKGAKCAILCSCNIETIKALFFCWNMEMIAVPLAMHYGIEHCAKIINIVQPDIILTDDLRLCEEYDKEKCVVLDNLKSLFALNIKEEEELRNVEIMMCTSGTTGYPKAIKFSAEAIQNNIVAISKYFPLTSKDTILICRPIYHCAVLVGELLLAIFVGANIELYSGGFNPLVITNILMQEEISVLCGTPTIFKGLASCIKHRNAENNIKTIALSGEYLLPAHAKDIREAFPLAKIFNVYGLTEAGPRVSFLPYELFDKNPSSVGQPLSGVDIKIVNENGYDVATIGEVWVRTKSIMSGYYKEAEKTLEKFHDGWFATGDLGTLDKNNYLYILGRSDDMIIKAGMNIYPQEIEKKIIQIPEIKEVLVYGKIENGIERIIAEVILNDCYKETTGLDIMEKVSQILPDYMMPAKVIIVDQLQKNASGKVLRPSKKARGFNDIV